MTPLVAKRGSITLADGTVIDEGLVADPTPATAPRAPAADLLGGVA